MQENQPAAQIAAKHNIFSRISSSSQPPFFHLLSMVWITVPHVDNQ